MRSSRSFCLFVIPHFLPCADGTEYCGGNGYYHFDYYFPVGCVEFAHVSVVFEFLVVIYRGGYSCGAASISSVPLSSSLRLL